MNKILTFFLLISCFLFTVLCPASSFKAASFGLTLWLDTLVPTLFPAMILTGLMVSTNLATVITSRISAPFEKTLSISPSGVYVLIAGFSCGYPMGIKVLHDLYQQDKISHSEAVYLSAFCNNVSPAFAINYLIVQNLGDGIPIGPTLAIIYGAPCIYGLLRSIPRRRQSTKHECIFTANKASFTAPDFAMIDACIINSIQNITRLGGYIVLFSVITEMLSLLPGTAGIANAVLTDLLEITAGIRKTAALDVPFTAKYIILITSTVFGGICSAVQSEALLRGIKCSLVHYVKEKCIIALIALLLTLFYV